MNGYLEASKIKHLLYLTVYTNFTYSSGNTYRDVMEGIKKESWYNTLRNSYSHQILKFDRKNFTFDRGAEKIYFAGSIIYDMENVGVMIVFLDKYYFKKYLDNVKVSSRSSLYIIAVL